MSTSCPSPLSLARIAAFDQANVLTARASKHILSGNLYQAAKLYEAAAEITGLSDSAKTELILVAVELRLELFAMVRPTRSIH
jgi:hypothetical protein